MDKKTLFNENNHLKETAFLMEEQGMLTKEESYLFLCHIESCSECMGKYIEYVEQGAQIEPPSELISNISKEAKKVREKRNEKKTLIIQLVKLAVAVCLTMVLFFGGISDRILNLTEEQLKLEFPIAGTEKPKNDALKEIGENFDRYFYEAADFINNSFRGDAKDGRKSTTNNKS